MQQAHGRALEIDLAHSPPFRLGDLAVQPSLRTVRRGERSVTLEPRVMQVLVALARAEGGVLSRDDLIASCWEGRVVGENAIARVIAQLRRINGELGANAIGIETIARVGYRLITEPGEADSAPAPRRRLWPWAAASLALLLAIGAALWLTIGRATPAAAEPVSLAVLPFRNLSPGEDYFAEGVAEEILAQLAREPGLRVAGRTSAWMFRDNADSRDVGRRLNVAYLLEGSVRRMGGQVVVNVALVDTRDGMRRWSQSFRGSLDDIFAIQSQVGAAVAGSLRQEVMLAGAAPARAPAGPRTRGDVYTLYLTARRLLRTREPANVETAADLLRQAVRLDANYAPAWATLADATAVRSEALGLAPETVRALREEARRHAIRAIRLAPGLPEAHGAFAYVLPSGPESLQHLEEAARLAPADAQLWYMLSGARGAALDFEGELEGLRRVAEIDPFWIRASHYPITAWKMGARDEALAFEQRLIQHHPEPLGRLMARMRVAAYRLDWSEAYRLALEADRLRPLQVRATVFFPEPVFLRLRLNRIDEAARLMTYPIVADMSRDAPPAMPELLRQIGSPAAFWESSTVRRHALLRLNQHGRGSDILALYDAVFSSPDAMAADIPSGPLRFLDSVGPVVVALRNAGRDAEATRMLALADQVVARILQRPRTLPYLLEAAARVRVLQGRREEALRLLERAVAMGWQLDWIGIAPRLADDPVYASLRNEPRLQRLDTIMQASIARERREAAVL